VVGQQCFRRPCCFHLQGEGGGSMNLELNNLEVANFSSSVISRTELS